MIVGRARIRPFALPALPRVRLLDKNVDLLRREVINASRDEQSACVDHFLKKRAFPQSSDLKNNVLFGRDGNHLIGIVGVAATLRHDASSRLHCREDQPHELELVAREAGYRDFNCATIVVTEHEEYQRTKNARPEIEALGERARPTIARDTRHEQIT